MLNNVYLCQVYSVLHIVHFNVVLFSGILMLLKQYNLLTKLGELSKSKIWNVVAAGLYTVQNTVASSSS